jgi:hypothetical protein
MLAPKPQKLATHVQTYLAGAGTSMHPFFSPTPHYVTMSSSPEDDMTFKQMAGYVRQAKAIIPRGGIYGDMHLVLAEVLNRKSEDALRDLTLVCKACEPLPWEWAQTALGLLRQAVDCLREQPPNSG